MSNSTDNTSMSQGSSTLSKTKKCQPAAGDRPDLIQTAPVPSTGHGQHTPRVTARSRSRPSGHTPHTPRVTVVVPVMLSGHTLHTPRVTVAVPVSSHGPVSDHRLTRKHNKNKQNEKLKNIKTNYLSHTKTDDLADSLPVANKLSVSRISLSQELNSPVSLPVANKKTEDRHPDDKWLMDALIKTTKCQSAVRDILLSGHTLHTPRVTVVVPVSGQMLSGHTPHTPRVTEVVPVSGHILSGHTLHTPRVTVVVPVSSHSPHTPRVTVGVPGSRQSRKQNKNKQNKKSKKTKTNYRSHVKTNDLADSLPVANKLSVSRIPLSQELNSPVPLPVANKKTEDSVKHPDDKWIKDVLTKISKCQPAVRDILPSGHTLHTPRVTVVVPVSGHMLSGHTLHTPRVTVVVPVSSHSPHTPQVTVGVPDSRLARQQNKNKQNEKYENQKSNYLSNVTMVDSVKLTKLISQSQVSRDTSVLKSRPRSRPVPTTGHGQHTPRVTAKSRSYPGHTPHTPRVTVVVPVSGHWPTGHTLQTPRVTVVVPVSGHGPHTPRVTVDQVHRSRSWSRPPGHGQHTPRVTVSLNFKHKVLQLQSRPRLSSHGPHTPRVTVVLRSRSRSLSVVPVSDLKPSGHTLHTPRVTVVVPVSGHGHGPHTPRVTVDHCPKVKVLRSWSLPSGHGTAVTPGHSIHHTSLQHHFTSVTRCCPPATKSHSLSNKTRNNLMKQYNGNGKNTILVSHWNLGSKKWINKRNQIQVLADQSLADIIFISEANLDESTPVYESVIQGYSITLPKTVTRNGTARLVMLTKVSLDFTLKADLMSDIFQASGSKLQDLEQRVF